MERSAAGARRYAVVAEEARDRTDRGPSRVTHATSAGEKIRTVVVEDHEDIARLVANRIATLIRERTAAGERTVLGLATGSTPIGVYRELIRMHREEGLTFKTVVTFNLDEYYPMPKESIHSYHRFMWENLFSHIDIKPENVHIPPGNLSRTDVVEAALTLPDICFSQYNGPQDTSTQAIPTACEGYFQQSPQVGAISQCPEGLQVEAVNEECPTVTLSDSGQVTWTVPPVVEQTADPTLSIARIKRCVTGPFKITRISPVCGSCKFAAPAPAVARGGSTQPLL